MKITGAQIRAARAFLRWTIADLAAAADVGLSTIQEVEKVDGEPRVVSTLQWRSDARDEALTKIRSALEKVGITFLPEFCSRGRAAGETQELVRASLRSVFLIWPVCHRFATACRRCCSRGLCGRGHGIGRSATQDA